jgi:hypothetical protein
VELHWGIGSAGGAGGGVPAPGGGEGGEGGIDKEILFPDGTLKVVDAAAKVARSFLADGQTITEAL